MQTLRLLRRWCLRLTQPPNIMLSHFIHWSLAKISYQLVWRPYVRLMNFCKIMYLPPPMNQRLCRCVCVMLKQSCRRVNAKRIGNFPPQISQSNLVMVINWCNNTAIFRQLLCSHPYSTRWSRSSLIWKTTRRRCFSLLVSTWASVIRNYANMRKHITIWIWPMVATVLTIRRSILTA